MQFCDEAVMLRSAVRLGVFHEYFVFAARPGVHLEVTWRSLGDHLEQQLEFTWSPLGGHLEAMWRPLGAQVGPTDAQKPPRAAKLSSRGAQERPS